MPPTLPADGPATVLLVYHGSPQTPEGIRILAAPEEPAAERGMLVVYPQSAAERWATNPDAYPGNLGIEDVRFTRALLDRIHQDIPLGSVLATGFSNGGLFLLRLACEMGDRLAGLGMVGATLSIRTTHSCSFPKPIPIVWFLGDQDDQFPFVRRPRPVLPVLLRRGGGQLVVVLLLPVLSLQLPRALPTARFGNEWLNVLKWLALSTGPLVLATHRPARVASPGRDRVIATGAVLAPWLLGAFMLGSAYMHLRYAEFVARLIQPWMPWRVFWTYFAGVALAAGALGLQIPRTARLAALLTGLMIFLWFFLVHIPRMLVEPAGPGGWSEMAESLAFSAMAFLLATRPPPDSVAKPPDVVSIRQDPDRRL